jgi:phenylpropionate dioxygenase-like ring-hydroxylating dioxygenase large terminal subunit
VAQFVKHTWYFAAWSDEIKKAPLHLQICGEHIALFRDQLGQVHAIGAVCPHRAANLGQGTVQGDRLECPYHGWQFDPTGRCVRIPSQPESMRIVERARVPAYSVVEQQGIVWIWPGQHHGPDVLAPHYDFFDPSQTSQGRTVTPYVAPAGPYEVQAPFVNMVENTIDNSHLYFVHKKSLHASSPLVAKQIVTYDEDSLGFRLRFDPDSPWAAQYDHNDSGPWLSKMLHAYEVGEQILEKSYWRFQMGGVVYYRLRFPKGKEDIVISTMTPIDAYRTRFSTAFVSTGGGFLSSMGDQCFNFLLRLMGNTTDIDSEDIGAVENLLLKGDDFSNPLNVLADAPCVAFRRLHAQKLAAEPEEAKTESHFDSELPSDSMVS